MILLTLPGMTFIYYGEELGMENVSIPPVYIHDPAAKGDPKHGVGRDPERTPMPWSSAKQAGFSESDHPWLPVAKDYVERNVEVEADDTNSFLSLYRALGQLRNNSDALKYGSLTVIDSGDPNVLAYISAGMAMRRATLPVLIFLINQRIATSSRRLARKLFRAFQAKSMRQLSDHRK